MTVSDRDRKILWARSGNKCALCRESLVAERTATDAAAVVGDEAHIVARSPGGPRWELLDERMIDAYENLILLCKVDHKRVDDQPGEYTKERLHEIKARHEAWLVQTLGQGNAGPAADLWSRVAPIRLKPDPSFGPVKLTLLVSGRAVCEVISNAHSFLRDSLHDDSDQEASDLADEFLDDAKDWGEISGEISDQAGIRKAERQFTVWLDRLAQRGLVVYGGRRRLILEGGTGPPTYWWQSMMQVVRVSDLLGGQPPED